MKDQQSLESGWFFHNHAWHLLHEIIKKIPRNEKLQLLDFGGGTGFAAAIIRSIFSEIDTFIIDIAEESEIFWNKRCLPGKIIKKNDAIPFSDNHFDIVISSHVIEHSEYPEKLIAEMYRVCKKRLIIAVPDGDTHFYDHKIVFNRNEFKKRLDLSGIENYNYEMFPIYHQHMNNLIMVIDKNE